MNLNSPCHSLPTLMSASTGFRRLHAFAQLNGPLLKLEGDLLWLLGHEGHCTSPISVPPCLWPGAAVYGVWFSTSRLSMWCVAFDGDFTELFVFSHQRCCIKNWTEAAMYGWEPYRSASRLNVFHPSPLTFRYPRQIYSLMLNVSYSCMR